jgi:ACS family hexuronate transporter-like MFS transporter
MTDESPGKDQPAGLPHSFTEVAEVGPASAPTLGERIGRYRWVICALLFFATTVNYIDRQVVGILAKELEGIFHWSEIDYGNITAAFSASYALGLILSGRLMDRFGTRLGYAVSIVIWSLAGMVTAAARSAFQFGLCRSLLGLGEAGNFPAAIKTVAEWFPKKERALATGIFNAGTNVGAIVAPLTVPWIYHTFGWKWAFILTGAIGFVWLTLWLPIYRKPEHHPKVSRGELAYIQGDPVDPPAAMPWLKLIPHRQAAAFAIAKYMTDPIWWFYLFWTPKFLSEKHHLDLSTIPLPLVVIYLIADVGSVGGGWLSSNLIKRGWSINKARKRRCSYARCWSLRSCSSLGSTVSGLPFPQSACRSYHQVGRPMSSAPCRILSKTVGSVVASEACQEQSAACYASHSRGQKTPGDYTINFIIAGSVYLVALVIVQALGLNSSPWTSKRRSDRSPSDRSSASAS